MDTKKQALYKAQQKLVELSEYGDVYFETEDGKFVVRQPLVPPDGGSPEYFEFNFSTKKPNEPIEQNDLGLVRIEPSKPLFLYSTGIPNEWYPPGYNSKNYSGWCERPIVCSDFEIIEDVNILPIPTPDHICIGQGCDLYVDKWLYKDSNAFLHGDKYLNENCRSCIIPCIIPDKKPFNLTKNGNKDE